METFEEYMKDKHTQEVINKIIELKTGPQTEGVKFKIQKLQQGLNK
jgi:hypothetical protein